MLPAVAAAHDDLAAQSADGGMDIQRVMQLLPHRYPFLMVDRIVKIEGNCITGLKNVTANEPYFQGHFPGLPVMPGVLVIEALAQAGGVLTQLSHQIDAGGASVSGRVFYLVKVDNAKFSRMVVPGDRLELHVELKRTIRNMALYLGVAKVDGEQVACAEILCAEVKG